MFIFSVKMKGLAEKRKEILQTVNGLSEQVRLKKGCLSANNYQDINDENTFCLLEMWRTQREMEEYLDSKLYAVLLGVEPLLVESPEVKIMVEDCSYNCDDRKCVKVH